MFGVSNSNVNRSDSSLPTSRSSPSFRSTRMGSWVRVWAGTSLCLVLTAVHGWADVVVPSPDVTTRVIVRESAPAQSAQIASLVPGQQLELVGSVPNWHEVRLPNGTLGFVSKRWTQVIPSGTPPPPPAGGPTFTIDVVDVGTGLAVLVRGADFTLVYDAGSNDDLARGQATECSRTSKPSCRHWRRSTT